MYSGKKLSFNTYTGNFIAVSGFNNNNKNLNRKDDVLSYSRTATIQQVL